MGFDDTDNPRLVLGLGFSNELKKATFTAVKPEQQPFSYKESENSELSLILSLSREPYDKKVRKDHQDDNLYRQDSVASSISHVTVKRERGIGSTTTTTTRVVMSDEDDDDDGGARKKLRLTKAQSAMLEESFKHRNSLNPKQKQELAKELNLRPRQVEVWFQNRRARTKLKQTEVDCEFLKKCCETLTEENRRLQKEVQELKALKVANPFYNMPVPVTGKLTICPSCERIAGVVAGEKTSKSSLITMAPKHHLLNNNPFANQSAAC